MKHSELRTDKRLAEFNLKKGPTFDFSQQGVARRRVLVGRSGARLSNGTEEVLEGWPLPKKFCCYYLCHCKQGGFSLQTYRQVIVLAIVTQLDVPCLIMVLCCFV